MSEMSQAQMPSTGATGPDPSAGGLSDEVPEVTENLEKSDRTQSDSETSGSGSGSQASGSVQPSDPEDDALLTADVGPDRNEPSEGGALSEPGDPDSASDPMPDIAGTGS